MQTNSIMKIEFLSINFEKFTSINQKSDQSQSRVWRAVIGHSSGLHSEEFLEVNGQQPNFQELLSLHSLSL